LVTRDAPSIDPELMTAGGEGFAVDASLIKVDANRQKGIGVEKGLPPQATSRAIDEYLAVARRCGLRGGDRGDTVRFYP
jgi:hypothetical protein